MSRSDDTTALHRPISVYPGVYQSLIEIRQSEHPCGLQPDFGEQVQIIHTNYWDVKESKIVQLYEMAKAVMTGKPPTDLGEHGEVRMR